MNINCPSCQVELRVRDSLAGRRVKCPHCAEMFRIEAVEPVEELLDFEEVSADSPPERRPAKSTAAANHQICPMCGARNRPSAEECHACGEPLSAGPSTSDRVWQDGKQLVMRKNATLPYRCIKTNEAADVLLPRKLYWHHPALYVVVVFSPLIYIILALLLRKKAEVELPVCHRLRQRRRTALILAWITGLGAIGMLVLGFVLGSQNQSQDYWILIGLVGMIAGLIGLVIALQVANLVTPAKIDERHVWLKGVHPDYLAGLPDWPGDK